MLHGRLLTAMSLCLIMGCKATENSNSEASTDDAEVSGLKVTIESPADQIVLSNPAQSTIEISGRCGNGFRELLITSPIRAAVSCPDNIWSFTLNLNAISEGEHTFRVETLHAPHFAARKLIKRFQPAHLIKVQKERRASSVNHLAHTTKGAITHALAYTSDESCIYANCSALNIVLRLRTENYENAYFATQDISIHSTRPQVMAVASGDLRVFYFSSLSVGGPLNIFYKDFYLATKTFSPAVQLTKSSSDVSHMYVLESLEGTELVYLSKEYCHENTCNEKKISIRNSQDNFQTVRYAGLHNTCQISELRATYPPTGNNLHLSYKLLDAPGCDIQTGLGEKNKPGSVEYLARTNGNWAAPVIIQFIHFGGSKLSVDGNGKVYLFYRSYQKWEKDFGCASWDLRYRHSGNGFATPQFIPGGCPMEVGYPGEDYPPGVFVKDDGSLQLMTARRLVLGSSPKYSIALTNSAQDFANFELSLQNDFGDFLSFALVPIEAANEYFVIQRNGANPGLIHVIQKSDGEYVRTNVSGSVARTLSVLRTGAGEIQIAGISTEWCAENSCDNENIYLENLATAEKKWMTKIKQSNLVLNNPLYAYRKTQPHHFIYTSNEVDKTNWGVTVLSASDNFAQPQRLGPVQGSAIMASNLDVDASENIHLATVQSTTLYTLKSASQYSVPVKVNTDAIISPNVQIRARADGEHILLYGSNGNSGKGRGKWSINSYATDLFMYADFALRYGARLPLWNLAGDAESYHITDNNADGRMDLVSTSSSSNFSSPVVQITSANQSLCLDADKNYFDVEYDRAGDLYIFYAAKSDNSNVCQPYVRRSGNSNQTWKLSSSATASYEPVALFLRENSLPIACARTNFELHCFDLNLLKGD